VKQENRIAEELPTNPETNARYSRLEQLNPEWWMQAATLIDNFKAKQISGILKSTEKTIEIPWFNRVVKIQPTTRTMMYKGKNQPPLSYQEGLVILSLLNYLKKHDQLPPDTELINENHLTGGTTFFRGPHLMASIILAQRLGDNGREFMKRALLWGGQPAPYGEFGINFEIFPGLNWTIALWESDSEFPARAQYLFDRKLDRIFQLDIIWAIGNLVAGKF